jgi:methylthioribose-1-phosphate isomerase
MRVNQTYYTSIWYDQESDRVLYIDQTRLPDQFVVLEMKTFEDGVRAIRDMEVRGAPLIGVAACFALYQGHKGMGAYGHMEDGHGGIWAYGHKEDGHGGIGAQGHGELIRRLLETRPTAVNLRIALEYMTQSLTIPHSASQYLTLALAFREEELTRCRRIGEHGVELIRKVAAEKKGAPVNIMTHCNAGWLATVDYGTALAPVYQAYEEGIPVHVWVSETRPRNQGSKLTAWELSQHGVPCTVVVDNACGHLMQKGEVDMVIVGADRITRNGDTANKIGTYLKALAAKDNHIPFYVAAPASTFDTTMESGDLIPIEERSAEELGLRSSGHEGVRNPAFDVTPAAFITSFITEDGLVH